jgi:hypothetical protein
MPSASDSTPAAEPPSRNETDSGWAALAASSSAVAASAARAEPDSTASPKTASAPARTARLAQLFM